MGSLLSTYSSSKTNTIIHSKNNDKPINDILILEFYIEVSQEENSQAQNNLGYCYQYGIGTQKDFNKAFKLYIKSAEQGNSDAQNNLGYCYKNGIGTQIDVKKAIELYTLAAEQGNLSGQYNLGHCYEHGIGVTKDANRAVEIYKKLAEQGHIASQYNLGYNYKHGIGVPKDLNKAIELYTLAAKQDDSYAKNVLKKIGIRFQLFDVNDECVICLEKFQDTKLCISLVPCNHYFHSKCLLKNHMLNDLCPICKQKINNIKDI
jgi:TPR repeat protein